MHIFEAEIEIIGINPFVFVPQQILSNIFREAGKDKGKIPVSGTLNGHSYKQTLVRYSGEWRLYVNTSMLKDSPKRVGEIIEITIAFDPQDRSLVPHPKLVRALDQDKAANAVFKSLAPSLQQEIVRYISNLKTEQSVEKNVARAINFLLGKERFIGREPIAQVPK